MAQISGLYSNYIFSKNDWISSSVAFPRPLVLSKTRVSPLKIEASDNNRCTLVQDRILLDSGNTQIDEKIQEIHTVEEYDSTLQLCQENLVIAHFSSIHYKFSNKIEHFMKQQCTALHGVKFLTVTANKMDRTRKLCLRESISRVPYFIFYRRNERVHEESGFQLQRMTNSILYYNDSDPSSPVVQLQSREDLERLAKAHMINHRLIVLNVGMRMCQPCTKVYPSVVKLAEQLAGRVVFARMECDESEEWTEMMRKLDVCKVPAFLFLKNGEFCGTYVGSCASALIREIAEVQNQSITNYNTKSSVLTSF